MEHQEKLDLYQSTINELRPFKGEMLKQAFGMLNVASTHTEAIILLRRKISKF